ncbi:MAG: hypothetical protein H6734_28360 [Alphaproteobacteria bacterium]|nr:hypothetical protein [Alphaproteobacteria bacterium]
MWWLALGSVGWAGTLEVSSMSVNDLELRDLSCTLDPKMAEEHGQAVATALAPVAIAGALSAGKPELDACAPEGHAFRATLRWTDVAAASVDASSASADAATCVQRVLGAIVPPIRGTCSVVLLTGPKEAAEAARAKLPAPAGH